MNSEIGNLALAFLAARCPAAYTAGAIGERLNDSGLLDNRITEDDTSAALGVLLRNGFVQSAVEPAGTRIYWNATPSGVQAWHASGRPHVGR
jgi:hypothetical protein